MRNMRKFSRKTISMDIPPFVSNILGRLEKAGFQAFIVGGAVRDLCSGRAVKDWDVATSASVDQVQTVFRDVRHFSLKHETVTLVHCKVHYDVTPFREREDRQGSLEGDLGDWSQAKVRLEKRDLEPSPESDAYFADLPSEMGDSKRYTALKKEFSDYLYYNSHISLWYNPHLELYSEIGEKRTIAFYTSPDLKDWKYQSHIDGFYECPEIFELPVDDDEDNTRWVVYAADGNYTIGRFDGKTFTPQTKKLQGNYGNCFYASQTYSDIPPEDGRRIQVAWGRIATPGMPFNQCMLFPCTLTLRTTGEGIRMFTEPIREIELLHNREHHWNNVALKRGENILSKLSGDLFHIEAAFDVRDADRIGFVIRGVEVSYDVAKQQLSCLDQSAPVQVPTGRVHLEILVDRTSIEIFANGGRVYRPMGIIAADEDRSLQVFGQGPNPKLAALAVHELDSAWNQGH